MLITIRNIKYGVIIAIAQTLLFAKCNKEPTPCPGGGGYSFLATAEWSPQQESYFIGDTLFLNSLIPKTLVDQINTSIVVNYSNSVGIIGDVSIIFLDSVTHQPLPGRDSFTFVSLIGSFEERIANQKFGISLRFAENANNYQFKGAIICNKKGSYGIGLQNLFSRGQMNKNCTNATFNMNVINSQKNLHIWENALQILIDSTSGRKGYAFRVR